MIQSVLLIFWFMQVIRDLLWSVWMCGIFELSKFGILEVFLLRARGDTFIYWQAVVKKIKLNQQQQWSFIFGIINLLLGNEDVANHIGFVSDNMSHQWGQ